MSGIIPYDERLARSNGGFITPNNEIILTDNHEKFAYNYCFGYDDLYNSQNEFKNSKLTSEELKLFKLWLKENVGFTRDMNSDFLLYIMRYDKVERKIRRVITTTNPRTHIRFYNYYLMDFDILIQRPKVFNEETRLFEYVDYNELWMQDSIDREAEKEINEIKEKVLSKDRYLYLK